MYVCRCVSDVSPQYHSALAGCLHQVFFEKGSKKLSILREGHGTSTELGAKSKKTVNATEDLSKKGDHFAAVMMDLGMSSVYDMLMISVYVRMPTVS